jgi:hypothetical protein
MRPSCLLIAMLLLTTLALAQDKPNAPLVPSQPGFYVIQGNEYKQMLAAPLQAIDPHMGRSMASGFTFGAVGVKVTEQIPGAVAPVSTSKRPVFLVVESPLLNPRGFQIVRLDKKKNHRELRITQGATLYNTKAGLGDPKWPFTVTQEGTGWRLTVSSDIPPGEYIVMNGMASSGYNGFDFSVNESR